MGIIKGRLGAPLALSQHAQLVSHMSIMPMCAAGAAGIHDTRFIPTILCTCISLQNVT